MMLSLLDFLLSFFLLDAIKAYKAECLPYNYMLHPKIKAHLQHIIDILHSNY